MGRAGRGKPEKVAKKYKLKLSAVKKYCHRVKNGIKCYEKSGKPPFLEEEDKSKLRQWFARKRRVCSAEEFHQEVVNLARARHISQT
eukprot:scaffold2708_cov158-Ochromonas_danica.AAC.7